MNELDRYLDDLGAQFADAKRPQRRWPALIPVGAVALGAALVLSLSGTDRPAAPVDAVAAARAALVVQEGEMLHLRIRLASEPPKGASVTKAAGSGIEEQWSAPPRWRGAWTDGRGDRQELAYGEGVKSSYTSEKDRLVRVSGYRDSIPQTRLPSLFGTGTDPASDLRAALEKGKLVDKGEVRVRGRTVRRLESKQKLLTLVYDVDPRTFAPVGGSRTNFLPHGGGGFVTRFTVELYERVPVDEAALTITPGPDTRVVTCRVRSVKQRPTACRAN